MGPSVSLCQFTGSHAFYVYKYCAILCWYVIVEVGAAHNGLGNIATVQ